MPRVTYSKGRLNSTNFSQFDPGVASSPLNEGHNLSKNELERHLQEHNSHIQKVADELKSRLLKYCDQSFEEFDRATEEFLSKGDFDFPVTIETLKVAKMIYKKCKKGSSTEAGNRIVNSIIGNGDKEDNSDSVEAATNSDTIKEHAKKAVFVVPEHEKSKKEEQNQAQKTSREETSVVFKKPAGMARRTRQTSRTISKEYQTPKRTGYNKGYNIAKVTPGPDIDRPLGVLRRPVPGEMAVSMNGSPLVTTHDNISVPQMTIPLANGKILTYLANEGLDPEESLCVDIDQETQERLAVFYKLLERKMKKCNGS